MEIKKILDKCKNDFMFRSIFTAIISIIISVFFAIYNLYLGIVYGDSWGYSISIYYALLIFVRCFIIIKETKYQKRSLNDIEIKRKRYKNTTIFIFFADMCLIIPISLMVIAPKDFNYGIIPAIAVAVYTIYKIVTAIINLRKSKKYENITIKCLKEIDIIDALVAILTLQRILIMATSGMITDMFKLSCASSFFIFALIIIITIVAFVREYKKDKR